MIECLVNFQKFLPSADFFFEIHIFQKYFHECHQSVKQCGSKSGLDSNCLQRLLEADDKSGHWQGKVRVLVTSCMDVCLFCLILYVPSTVFQLNRDGSSWVEPVLSRD